MAKKHELKVPKSKRPKDAQRILALRKRMGWSLLQFAEEFGIQRRNREDPPIKREDVSKWYKVFQKPTSDELKLFDKAKTISTE